MRSLKQNCLLKKQTRFLGHPYPKVSVPQRSLELTPPWHLFLTGRRISKEPGKHCPKGFFAETSMRPTQAREPLLAPPSRTHVLFPFRTHAHQSGGSHPHCRKEAVLPCPQNTRRSWSRLNHMVPETFQGLPGGLGQEDNKISPRLGWGPSLCAHRTAVSLSCHTHSGCCPWFVPVPHPHSTLSLCLVHLCVLHHLLEGVWLSKHHS